MLIISNLGQKEDIEKGIKIGSADYIIKAEASPSEIIEKMKSIIK